VRVVCLSFGERGESERLWKIPGMTVERVKKIAGLRLPGAEIWGPRSLLRYGRLSIRPTDEDMPRTGERIIAESRGLRIHTSLQREIVSPSVIHVVRVGVGNAPARSPGWCSRNSFTSPACLRRLGRIGLIAHIEESGIWAPRNFRRPGSLKPAIFLTRSTVIPGNLPGAVPIPRRSPKRKTNHPHRMPALRIQKQSHPPPAKQNRQHAALTTRTELSIKTFLTQQGLKLREPADRRRGKEVKK